MKQFLLTPQEVLAGYDAVKALYPHIPPINMWRAWEHAAYQHYKLPEPVLDVGCGDGAFFRLVWPKVKNVTGVDADAATVERARNSGVYREVHVAQAHEPPVQQNHFGSAFSNCALEHMDHLDGVLSAIFRSLRPGGVFLASVVTDRFISWATLPKLMQQLELPEQGRQLQKEYEDYHHLANPFSVETWRMHLETAGFEVVQHVPIVPDIVSRCFLFMDALWHTRNPTGEIGDHLQAYFEQRLQFPEAFRHVLQGLLLMEKDWSSGSGAVFFAKKP